MIAGLRRRVAAVVGRDRAQDLGISLVELLVAMMIFSLLLAMTVGFFVSASRANVTNQQIDTTNRTASSGMDEVARIIRGAITNPVSGQQLPNPAFPTAGSNTMTLYTNVNLGATTSTPEMVQFSLSGTNLVEKTWQPVLTSGYYVFPAVTSTPTTSRIIASPIVLSTSGGPNLFTYVDTTGAAIATTSGAVPTANVASIAAVTVNLQVGTFNTAYQSTLLTNTVGLPNLNISRNPS